jgi:hypothetical protein
MQDNDEEVLEHAFQPVELVGCLSLQEVGDAHACEEVGGFNKTTTKNRAKIFFITTAVPPGPDEIWSGRVETEFQGRLRSSYDARPVPKREEQAHPALKYRNPSHPRPAFTSA